MFTWTQSRRILPGWYGIASGIDADLQEGSVATLQEMYDEWSFFQLTADNAARSLSRTDLEIAVLYADLADEDLHERFFPKIYEEHERASSLLTEIGRRDTLHTRGWMGVSLDRRNLYVDPLNVLQAHSWTNRSGRT